jgi:YqaJ-like viral recombinase domain
VRLLMSAAAVRDDPDGWLEARRSLITATKIGVIMKLDGAHLTGEFAQSPYSVWMEMTGRSGGAARPPARVSFGQYCEPWIEWDTARQRPDLHITPGGLYVDDDRPWMGATFDRMAHPAAFCGGGGCALVAPTCTVQMKTDMVRDYDREGIPLAYWAQCIWEAHVARVGTALLPVLDKATTEVKIYTIDIGEDTSRDLKLMIEAGEEFLDLVRTGTRPEIDWLPATTQALYQLHPVVDKDAAVRIPLRLWRAWRRAALRVKHYEQRRDYYKNLIIDRAGGAGQIVITDPATGDTIRVATQNIYDRAGHEVQPKTGIRSLNPSTKKDLPL